MPARSAERFDVAVGGLGDPEPVQREQRDQGMLNGSAESGDNKERPTSLRSSPVAARPTDCVSDVA